MKNLLLFLFLLFGNALASDCLSREQIIAAFHEHGIVRYGDFTLKGGMKSSIYIDARRAMSCPTLFSSLGIHLKKLVEQLSFDYICGVPYGAVPAATMMTLFCKKPLIMCRKEVKEHGTKNLIEGNYNVGKKVLVVEDVVTTGQSVLQMIALLEKAGLQVVHIVIIVDREQGGVEMLQKKGYSVQSLFKLSELCQ